MTSWVMKIDNAKYFLWSHYSKYHYIIKANLLNLVKVICHAPIVFKICFQRVITGTVEPLIKIAWDAILRQSYFNAWSIVILVILILNTNFLELLQLNVQSCLVKKGKYVQSWLWQEFPISSLVHLLRFLPT